MLTPDIKSKINQLWDKFWSGGIANPLTAIEQISYLLFLKRLEVLDNENLQNSNAASKHYESIFAGKIVIIQRLKRSKSPRRRAPTLRVILVESTKK